MGTSLLQKQTVKQLDRIYGCHAVQENVRPEWLIGPNGHRLELDVFVPTAKIAIEVQGPQHYRFSEHHHRDAAGFEAQQKRDSQKRVFCTRKGITLYEVASHSDLNDVIAKLKNKPPRVDPRHTQRAKEIQNAEKAMMDEKYVLWATGKERRRLEAAIQNLKETCAALPIGVEHTNDTDKASAIVIRCRNKLQNAETRAWKKRELGRRKQ